MQALRWFFLGLLLELCICLGSARQAHLRQMHVVSLGEGNVDCDDVHNSACGDGTHPHETRGVLLLPVSKSRWHAFNVDTLMLPQHAVAVSKHVSQSTLQKVESGLLHLAQSGKGISGTILFLGLFICIGFLVLNMMTASEPEYKEPVPSEFGSWEQAYRESRGLRREAIDLLFSTHIIAHEDRSLRSVHTAHIEECVQVAAQMLKERKSAEWIADWKHAQHTFEERYSAISGGPTEDDVMAEFEFCDGSWSRAYLHSEGQRDRREAFQLLLRLGIVSKAEFRDSLVSPPYIEERLSVAMNLLQRQSLSQWVALCDSVEGYNAKASIMAQFASGGETPTYPQESSQPTAQRSVTAPQTVHSPELRTVPADALPRQFRRGATETTLADDTSFFEGHKRTDGHSTFSTSSPVPGAHERQQFTSKHADTGDEPQLLPQVTRTEPLVPRRNSPRGPDSSRMTSPGSSAPVFVLPVSPMQEIKEPTGHARTLPPTAFAPTGSEALPRLSTPERPRTLNWPSSSASLGAGRETSPRTGAIASHGVPVQIKFANNAISGSSWEKTATPPGSQRFPKDDY